jgi:hypothetical protein
VRLTAADLEVLGVFLFGPRWQTALARALGCSDRLVRYWVSGRRPVSIAASRRIAELVRNKHGERMRRTRAYYLDMIGGLSDTRIKGRLLAMDLSGLKIDDGLRRAQITAGVTAMPLAAD